MKTITTSMILKKSTSDVHNVISSANFTVRYIIAHHDDGSVRIGYDVYPTIITSDCKWYAPMLKTCSGILFADTPEEGVDEMMRMFIRNNDVNDECANSHSWRGETDLPTCLHCVPTCEFTYNDDTRELCYTLAWHKDEHTVVFDLDAVANITDDMVRLSYRENFDGYGVDSDVYAICIDDSYEIVNTDKE